MDAFEQAMTDAIRGIEIQIRNNQIARRQAVIDRDRKRWESIKQQVFRDMERRQVYSECLDAYQYLKESGKLNVEK